MAKKQDLRVPTRITPTNPVAVEVHHFNFLRYSATIKEDTQLVPGYTTLERLWKQLVNIPGTDPTKAGGVPFDTTRIPTFLQELAEWRRQVADENKTLSTFLADTAKVPQTVALTDLQVDTIRQFAKLEQSVINSLERARQKTENAILNQYATDVIANISNTSSSLANVTASAGGTAPPASPSATTTDAPISEAYFAQQLYDAELVQHKAFVDKMQSFLTLAADAVNGRRKDLGTQKAGTIVTVTITPVATNENASAAATDATIKADVARTATVTYVVQSSMPLFFHVGPTFLNIKDVDFQKIQHTGQDAWQQIAKSDNGADLTAFLSYMVPTNDPNDLAVGLTLGTGLRSVGKQIFGGASLRVLGRVFVTAGMFSQTVKDGKDAIPDGQDLFKSFQNVTGWGRFAALSFSAF